MRSQMLAVGAVIISLSGCGPREQDASAANQAASDAPVEDRPALSQPADEIALIDLFKLYNQMDDHNEAPNDIVKAQLALRDWKAFCTGYEKMETFANWTGMVTNIAPHGDQASDGSYDVVSIDVQITPGVENRIFLDDNVERGSPVYTGLSHLKEDQLVTVSGAFVHGDVEKSQCSEPAPLSHFVDGPKVKFSAISGS